MGCCGEVTQTRSYPQATPAGGTVNIHYNGGGGAHSLKGPITGTKYRIGSDGIMRPAVFIEDAQIILNYGGKFEEV